jgi:hypothetical protein
MKRIYLLGAILFLLAIAVIDYCYKGGTDVGFDNNAVAATIEPAVGLGVPAASGTQTSVPVNTQIVVKKIITSADVCVRHDYPKHKATAVKYASVATDRTGRPAKVIPGAYVQDDELVVERSNEYYAKVPSKKEAVRVRKVSNRVPYEGEVIYEGALRGGLHRIGFGPEIGFNQNTLNHSNTPNMATGNVHVGIVTSISLGDNVAVTSGIRYITKGTKTVGTMDVFSREKLKLHYLQVPADIIYKFGDAGNARLMLGAGPYVSYLVSAKDAIKTSNDGFVDVLPVAPNFNKNNIAKLDWGFNGFVGVDSPEGLFIKAGVDVGMKDIQQDPVKGSSDRNFSFLITAGYILGGYNR